MPAAAMPAGRGGPPGGDEDSPAGGGGRGRRAGYRILDHPSDVGIEAFGTTLREAFEQAAHGLMSIILEPSLPFDEHGRSASTREVAVTGSDYAQLLVRWLGEILYLYDGRQFVARKIVIDSLSPEGLRARVSGEPFSPDLHRTKLDVKAITYHQIAVREGEGGELRVFVDI